MKRKIIFNICFYFLSTIIPDKLINTFILKYVTQVSSSIDINGAASPNLTISIISFLPELAFSDVIETLNVLFFCWMKNINY